MNKEQFESPALYSFLSSSSVRDEFIALLKSIKEEALEGRYKDHPTGICFCLHLKASVNLPEFFFSYQLLAEPCLVQDWEHFSGDFTSPIPFEDAPLWEGSQLNYRISLIEHIITKLHNFNETKQVVIDNINPTCVTAS